MFAAQAHLVCHFAIIGGHGGDAWLGAGLVDAEVAFGENDELLARDVILLDGFADDFFGATVGVDVGLCRGVSEGGGLMVHWEVYGVPGIQANFVGVFEEWQRLLFIENPFLPFLRTVRHCPQDHFRDLEARVA